MHQDSTQPLIVAIKEAREKKGISQRALSIETGIPQSHISKIERGFVDVQISTLIQIVRALELELVVIEPRYIPAVRAIRNHTLNSKKQTPAYQLPGHEEDDDE